MSRIVVLIGSMRKNGNTDLLAQAFVEGASKNNDVEVISVCDPRNTCTWKLSEKVGLKHEAHFKQNIFCERDENIFYCLMILKHWIFSARLKYWQEWKRMSWYMNRKVAVL